MAIIFTVEPVDNQIKVVAGKASTMRFLVTNKLSQSIDGRLRVVVPEEKARAEWFSIEGGETPRYAENEACTHVVKVEVPKGTAAGSYSFRLDAATERDPDHETTLGPVVAFDVTGAPSPTPGMPVWAWVLIGIGALLVLGGGGFGIYKLLSPPPAPKIASFSVEPLKITKGQKVTISWTTEDAETVQLNGEDVAPTGSQTKTPNATKTFALVAKNGDEVDSKEAEVKVAVRISPTPETCFKSVQGKIPWNYQNARQWSPVNINNLCRGAENSAEPGRCFKTAMHGNTNWGGGTVWQWKNALNLCKGTRNATKTIACFKGKVASGQPWTAAIAACN